MSQKAEVTKTEIGDKVCKFGAILLTFYAQSGICRATLHVGIEAQLAVEVPQESKGGTMTRPTNLVKTWWLGVRARRKASAFELAASPERAFIYVRSACVPNDTGGQLRLCHDYARRHGMTIVAQVVDAPVSGSSDERPGFAALLAAVANGGIDVVLVEDVDRISRSAATLDYFLKLAFRSMVRVVPVARAADRYELDPNIAAIVPHIHQYYAAGRTPYQISEVLTDERVPSARRKRNRRPH